MKKLILTTLICLFFISAKSQDRIQSINSGISKMGISKQKMEVQLNNYDFHFDNKSENLYSYSKITPEGYTMYYMVSYSKLSKVTNIVWDESMINSSQIFAEIRNAGFETVRGDSGTVLLLFRNPLKNLQIQVQKRMDDLKLIVSLTHIN